jgi:hypothetical protein
VNFYVPAEGRIYVAPGMMLHYVDAHEYAPPAIYQEAAVRCPPMRSMDYFRAILRTRYITRYS